MLTTVEFYKYTNTFTVTADGTWRTKDISSLLNDTENVKAVIISAQLPNVAGAQLGCRPVGSTLVNAGQSNFTTAQWIVPVTAGSGAINIEYLNAAANTAVWSVIGQINKGFKALGLDGQLVSTTASTWVTNTIVPVDNDLVSDIECALIRIRASFSNGTTTLGLRGIGKAGWFSGQSNNWQDYAIVPIDSNGQFQFYRSNLVGKNVSMKAYIIGYIKKGYGITAQDAVTNYYRPPNPINSWNNKDLVAAGLIPSTAEAVFVEGNHNLTDSGLPWHFEGVRNWLTTSGGKVVNLEGHHYTFGATLDASKLIQTWKSESIANKVIHYVTCYYDPTDQYLPNNNLKIKGGTLKSKGGTLKIGI